MSIRYTSSCITCIFFYLACNMSPFLYMYLDIVNQYHHKIAGLSFEHTHDNPNDTTVIIIIFHMVMPTPSLIIAIRYNLNTFRITVTLRPNGKKSWSPVILLWSNFTNACFQDGTFNVMYLSSFIQVYLHSLRSTYRTSVTIFGSR